jgi:hypothetical protein
MKVQRILKVNKKVKIYTLEVLELGLFYFV